MTTKERAQEACLIWISDPSHGWLAVSLDDEDGFPDAVDFAGTYSYLDITGANFAGIVYLEEDVDAPAFIKAYGINPTLIAEHNNDELSYVRGLPKAK